MATLKHMCDETLEITARNRPLNAFCDCYWNLHPLSAADAASLAFEGSLSFDDSKNQDTATNKSKREATRLLFDRSSRRVEKSPTRKKSKNLLRDADGSFQRRIEKSRAFRRNIRVRPTLLPRDLAVPKGRPDHVDACTGHTPSCLKSADL
eukprot:6193499-Pleurochrysis_carterae.AAC.1